MTTVYHRVFETIRRDAVKHGLWEIGHIFDNPEEYVISEINAMTPYELLSAISLAVGDLPNE